MKKIFKCIGLLILAIVVASCASTKPYEVNWPEAQSTLGGKKAVILNFGMAERALAKSGAAWIAGVLTLPVGGLFYITVPEVLSAAQFNVNAKRVSSEVIALQNEQKPILTQQLTNAYKETFNAEVKNIEFPFNNEKITLKYFLKPTSETKESIASIAASNNAEFVIAAVNQIVTGGRGDAWRRKTDIVTIITIFDKTGNIIAGGNTSTPGGLVSINVQAVSNTGGWLGEAPGQVEDLRRLFAVSGQNNAELIRSLK